MKQGQNNRNQNKVPGLSLGGLGGNQNQKMGGIQMMQKQGQPSENWQDSNQGVKVPSLGFPGSGSQGQ